MKHKSMRGAKISLRKVIVDAGGMFLGNLWMVHIDSSQEVKVNRGRKTAQGHSSETFLFSKLCDFLASFQS
jgi:hypothetical protein